jgi:hypothetical protein
MFDLYSEGKHGGMQPTVNLMVQSYEENGKVQRKPVDYKGMDRLSHRE